MNPNILFNYPLLSDFVLVPSVYRMLIYVSGIKETTRPTRRTFGALSFETSESGMLTAKQKAIDVCASQFAAGVEVVDLILSEEETGCGATESDSQWFRERGQLEFCPGQQGCGFVDQVFAFGFIASHGNSSSLEGGVVCRGRRGR